ncbi:nucleotide sugar dehydrogenase [Schaalia sp. JY-X159]|uniref:nucleotide sugar dehydrogenase n=1 Tax=Schaalia sp. JY-X159 TaxID=2758575 RepID=UPI00165D9072|nr:nucleotide sugar dehydrogenase [Schaalia sp. JY-X159]
MNLAETKLAVIGLGYVGLPLAVEFGKQFPTVGFDIKESRVAELQAGHDRTLEVEPEELASATQLTVTADEDVLDDANVFIVTAPTPIDKFKKPDLTPLLGASRTVGRHLRPGDVVIFESTVYPGATEEDCVPILEQESGLKLNEDFFVGYSPERINPGDKERRVTNIMKITSGSTPEAADFIDDLYQKVIVAGTHKAPTIKVAEAAKVIENTQRDVNIALMNELAILFGKLGINTRDVLEAAGTKWNFLKFTPGLVGGHCIGVDPYYLTHKAQSVGHHPEMILAGRRINDSMGPYVASQLVKEMAKRGVQIKGAKVLVLGLTFKENTPDLRNTKVIDVIRELEDYGIDVDVHDPWADPDEAVEEFGIELVETIPETAYDGVILAVAHSQFADSAQYESTLNGSSTAGPVVYDLKGALAPNVSSLWL